MAAPPSPPDDPVLGVDFGTATSSMAWCNPRTGHAELLRNAEGEYITPSVVYFVKGSHADQPVIQLLADHHLVVGTQAERRLEDPSSDDRHRVIVSAKRALTQNTTVTLPEVLEPVASTIPAAAIFAKLRSDASELTFHAPIHRGMITCPATFDALQRDRLRDAATQAGFDDITLVDEPIAAAIAFTRDGFNPDNAILVYDLGAGAVNLAVVSRDGNSFRVALEPEDLPSCGGDDVDQALYDYLDARARETLGFGLGPEGLRDLRNLHQCRQYKEALSSTSETQVNLLLEHGDRREWFRETLTVSTLDSLIDGIVRPTAGRTRDLLQRAHNVGVDVERVLLVGGSTRLPIVQRILAETLQVPRVPWANRDVAVALGAAYAATPTVAATVDAPRASPTVERAPEVRKALPHFAELRTAEITTQPLLEHIAVSPGGEQIVGRSERHSSGTASHSVVEHGLAAFRLPQLEPSAFVTSVVTMTPAFSPDGSLVAWPTRGGISIRTANGTRQLLRGQHGDDVEALAFWDGSTLAVSYASQRLVLWNTATRTSEVFLTAPFDTLLPVTLLAVSSQRLLVGGDRQTTLYDRDTKKPLVTYPASGGRGPLRSDASGRWLVRVGPDRCLRVWDIQHGELHRQFAQFSQPPQCLMMSADGLLVAVGIGPTVYVYELDSGRMTQSLIRHRQPVTYVAFLPGSKQIVSVSNAPGDRTTVVLWTST